VTSFETGKGVLPGRRVADRPGRFWSGWADAPRVLRSQKEKRPASVFVGLATLWGGIIGDDDSTTCRVPQLMSVLLTEFLSAFEIFSVFVEIDFIMVD
jgi:hypothetical protein